VDQWLLLLLAYPPPDDLHALAFNPLILFVSVRWMSLPTAKTPRPLSSRECLDGDPSSATARSRQWFDSRLD